jgi:hypothetical protein
MSYNSYTVSLVLLPPLVVQGSIACYGLEATASKLAPTKRVQRVNSFSPLSSEGVVSLPHCCSSIVLSMFSIIGCSLLSPQSLQASIAHICGICWLYRCSQGITKDCDTKGRVFRGRIPEYSSILVALFLPKLFSACSRSDMGLETT